ncbi:bifunctional pyridoxamine 5'-phosphate oxidase family protein/GNAT family N-acetyltransferase [Micromonospora humi]|uniref:Nitroimidazol reductase NimA, pyridoxamine 5'-phosphate oxidase superfamily n=1 Tax=Micromonospora humi TaxID=745366 RepID=A0A1C5K9U4_9ACTN|nr:bifunctional pyridoxamine 5'-phosphate oxidase family protein/GNAT family N-acetyltransferase [Micromonospora humi]SCG79430.1 Nitroimidazol reductase NimA, pyridoxamine 5'-phosphate oxidase superfamily [Micromonospora humi]
MYPPTGRTTATRTRDRMRYDRATAHAVLDEAYHCALAFVVDGEPRVLPTLHVRVGDTLYLHGSTGSRPLLAARGDTGLPVCVSVTHLDGLVYARSQFHHSANYRSVVAHGTARLVDDADEKARVLAALVEKVAAGRSAESRPPNRRELAETAVLALPLREVSVRVRTGGVNDEPADESLPYWAGVLPLRLTPGRPEPADGVTAPVPAYLRPARSPWLEPVVLRGAHVVLEPLDLSHAEDLHAALDDEEVWRYVGSPRPTSVAGMADLIRAALDAGQRGVRTAWVQRCAVTGAVVGTTSFHEPDADLRAVEIGSTQLGRAWWRTGINTEAKLLLLTRAFDELDAVRVTWQTSTLNERSQRAIERLGAVREGTLRSNRRRADGTWRQSALYSMLAEEWPNAQVRLRAYPPPAEV